MKEIKKKAIVISTLVVILSSIIDPILEVKGKKDGVIVQNIEFTTNSNEVIKTSQTFIYIGRTKSFVFLYDSINGNSLVYKNEDVSDFKVIKN